jgi:hypothetical protein
MFASTKILLFLEKSVFFVCFYISVVLIPKFNIYYVADIQCVVKKLQKGGKNN